LVGGQAEDLAVGDGPVAAERIEWIHARKTAALIRAAAVAGARVAGASPATLERFQRFGTAVGVAFQIADDLLDQGDAEACSLVAVLGESAARERAEALLALALAELEALGEPAEPLRELSRMAVRRMH
ncbi:MAG: hypothetical protein HKP30_03795, partial [Myxococcales bacterium]|nr:hypothetical protein [Myxococcales bacterium]